VWAAAPRAEAVFAVLALESEWLSEALSLVTVMLPHHIATVPHLRNAGRPRVLISWL
jgi:hypothetical protein